MVRASKVPSVTANAQLSIFHAAFRAPARKSEYTALKSYRGKQRRFQQRLPLAFGWRAAAYSVYCECFPNDNIIVLLYVPGDGYKRRYKFGRYSNRSPLRWEHV